MHTGLSDALHFLVGVLCCSGLVSVTVHGDAGPQSLQGCACSSLRLLWASVTSEVYLLWHGLAVGQSPLRSESSQARSESFCGYVSIHVLGVFSMCCSKSSSSVSLHVFPNVFPQEYLLLMCLRVPLASSCHSFLEYV